MALSPTVPGLDNLQISGITAFPLTITELSAAAGPASTLGTGPRSIQLFGRSLPYQGVAFGSEQRINLKYFVGNPTAQAQVLGATWTETSMEGRWCDRHLIDPANAPILFNFPPIGSAGKPETPWKFTDAGGSSFESAGSIPVGRAQRARTVRDAIFMMQRGGQLLRVEWGSIVRCGFIKSFVPTHDREEDIGWQIDFEWIGDQASFPEIRVKPAVDPLGLLGKLQAALAAALAAMQKALSKVYGQILAISQKITAIGNAISSLIDTITLFAKLAFLPLEMIGTIRQQIRSIILSIRDLIQLVRSIPGAYAALRDGGTQSQADEASAITVAIAINAAKLGVDLSDILDDLKKLEEGDILGITNMPEGSTLPDLARDWYGDPSSWRLIADYNNFSSMIIRAGTRVLIPKKEGAPKSFGSKVNDALNLI